MRDTGVVVGDNPECPENDGELVGKPGDGADAMASVASTADPNAVPNVQVEKLVGDDGPQPGLPGDAG